MIITILNSLACKENGITGRYAIRCPACGCFVEVFVELYNGSFCYTINMSMKIKHKDCGWINSDYVYFYAQNPFYAEILREYEYSLRLQNDEYIFDKE